MFFLWFKMYTVVAYSLLSGLINDVDMSEDEPTSDGEPSSTVEQTGQSQPPEEMVSTIFGWIGLPLLLEI